jgi:predicted Zn-dependent protease
MQCAAHRALGLLSSATTNPCIAAALGDLDNWMVILTRDLRDKVINTTRPDPVKRRMHDPVVTGAESHLFKDGHCHATAKITVRYSVRRSAVHLSVVLLLAPTAPSMMAQDQVQSDAEKTVPPVVSANQPGTDSTAAQPVADAEAAIARADWKTAEARLDPWLVSHSSDARALFDAGYVADAQGRLEDAAELYRRASEANPRSLEAHLSLGLLLARQGKLEEARPELIAATKLDPGDAGPALKARAWRALAEADKPGPGNQGDATEASAALLEALKLSPETTHDTLLAANLAETTGQLDSAEAAYRRVLAKDPKSGAANAGLAHLLIAKKRYPEAETILRAALAQSPENLALNAQLATVLAAQDKAEAVPLLQGLHDAHPQDANITRMLADVLAQAGDVAGSDSLCVSLLALHPQDPDLLVAHGQNLIRLVRYPAALATFNKVVQIDPANGDGWGGLAFVASKTGQPTVALHALTMRSKFLPEVPATYFLWATSYDTMHEKAQAIAYYHLFLDSAAGKFPDQEWQAKQRLLLLEKKN